MLEHTWARAESGLSVYPLVFLNPVAFNVLEFAKTTVEFMSAALRAAFDERRDNPFALRHVRVCHSLADLDRLPSPKIVLTSHPGLEVRAPRYQSFFAPCCRSRRSRGLEGLVPCCRAAVVGAGVKGPLLPC